MAIMKDIRGLKVEIVSNGKACAEFADEEAVADLPHGGVVAKYVESIPDSIFEVHVHVSKTYPYRHHDLCIMVYLGDAEASRTIYTKGVHFRHAKWATLVSKGSTSKENGQTTMRRFKFQRTITAMLCHSVDDTVASCGIISDEEIVEKGAVNGSPLTVADVKRMNEVQVDLFRAVRGQDLPDPQMPYEFRNASAVEEGKLKGRSVSTRIGYC
jgi:hypothetical protein